MAHFKIVDDRGELVAGLDSITEEHSAFTSSRIAWPHSPLKLREHEGMTGTVGKKVYRALRLPDEREERLAALGFEEPSEEQRKENITLNVDQPLASGSLIRPSIVQTSGTCGGRARIDGTRIAVWVLAALWRAGVKDEELLPDFPALTPQHLEEARRYIQEHPEEIERDLQDQETVRKE